MLSAQPFHRLLTLLIAAVWFINGLFCKVLNMVPRHQQIVAEILGPDFAGLLTKAIGVGEICIALWVLSRFKSKLSVVVQIVLVATMNIMEFILVPDLLLFGRGNSAFALVFIAVIYVNEFVLNKKTAQPTMHAVIS